MDFVFDVLDDQSPHSRGKGIFSYRNTQINEMGPMISNIYAEDLRNTAESCYIVVPSIKMTFVQVGRASKRTEEEIQGS